MVLEEPKGKILMSVLYYAYYTSTVQCILQLYCTMHITTLLYYAYHITTLLVHHKDGVCHLCGVPDLPLHPQNPPEANWHPDLQPPHHQRNLPLPQHLPDQQPGQQVK